MQMPRTHTTAKKLVAIAAIAASSIACNAQQQVDRHTLDILRTEYPNGVPGYLDWNDPNKNEMMQRAAHLARQPWIMQQGEETATAEDRKASAKWGALVGAVLFTGLFYSRNYKNWAKRRKEADQQLGSTEDKHFSISNVLRKGTIECRALEETSNSVSCGFLKVITLGIAKGFIPGAETLTSTSPVVEYKSAAGGARRMVLVSTDGSWIWSDEPK
jgi:hypothetical protein